MTINDYITLLRRVRETFDVAGFNLGGINMWPLFRLLMFYAHEYKYLPALAYLQGGAPQQSPTDFSTRQWGRGRELLTGEDLSDARLLLSPTALRNPDILVFQAHTDYTVRSGEDVLEPLAMGLRQTFDQAVSISPLCNWHPALYETAAKQGGMLYTPYWRAWRAAPCELFPWMRKAAALCDFCNEELGEPGMLAVDMLAWMQRMLGIVPAFSSLLQRIDPKVVVLQSSLCLEKLGLIIAARRLGVPVVDHQHGLFTRTSELYVSWIDVGKGVVDPTPHVFWLWSDYFARNMPDETASVSKTASGDLRWRPAGEARALPLPPAARRVLYLHQGLLGDDASSDMALLPTPVMDAVRDSPKDWQWLIRLHPRCLQMAVPLARSLHERGIGNAFVEIPSRALLQSCLLTADVAVTGYSASAMEASDHGLPVVLHDPLGRTMFDEAIATGFMSYADTGSGLVQAIAAARPAQGTFRFIERSPELAAQALWRALELGRRLRRDRVGS